MSDAENIRSYIYDKNGAQRITDWFHQHANFILTVEILKHEHLRNRSAFSFENLLKKGFSEEFLGDYLGDYNEPTATFVIILSNNARQYGFPANAAIIGLAMENGLDDNRIEEAMKKLTVPTSA